MSKFCHQCGKLIPDLAIFCQYCGYNLSSFGISNNASDYYTRVPNVRKLCWGDSKEYVKSVEGDPVYESYDTLSYNVKLCGYDSILFLKFDNNGLFHVGYMIDDDNTTQASILLSEYYAIVDRLTEKFGTPTHDEIIVDTLMQYCDTKYKAIELGYLIIKDDWYNTTGSNISIFIGRLNDHMEIIAKFEDEKYIAPEPEDGF